MEREIAQILNGTIDPGWVISILMGICIVLLIRILNRHDKRLDDHELQLRKGDHRITKVETKLNIRD